MSFRNILRSCYRLIVPIFDIRRFIRLLPEYKNFFFDLKMYKGMVGAEPILFTEWNPQLFDRTTTTVLDSHYFYQAAWMIRRMASVRPLSHVDVGSEVNFVGMLSATVPVTFVDIRPLETTLDNLTSVAGSILSLPFLDKSILSASCLHVAEHIGLGRYGDDLDPLGTRKATQELTRILAPDGTLYFSLPVGKSQVCFNAHRVHSPQQIFSYFNELSLLEFSGVTDDGVYIENADPAQFAEMNYACGFFRFRRI